MSFRSSRPALACALTLTLSASATAQQSDSVATRPAVKDTTAPTVADKWGTIPARWSFAAGGYLPHIGTSMTLSSALLPATEIDLEKKLGLKSNTQTIDLFAAYRFSKRHLLSLEYFNVSRTGSKTLSDSIIVNDTVYHAGLAVNTHAKLEYYGLTYRYYIWRRQRWELGAGLGIDVMNIGLGLGLRANAAGRSDSLQTSGGFTAPVPLLGFYADWEVVPRVRLNGTFQTFYIANVSSYGGSVKDRRIDAEWYPWDNYGFGLGWHYVGIDAKKTFPNGGYVKADYSIQGLTLYAAAAFGAPQPVAYRPSKPRTEPPPGQDFGLVPRLLSVAIGAYGPNISTQAQLKTPSNAGDNIDLEEILGLPPRTQSLVVDIALRVGNKSLITASYFGFDRSGSATLGDSITFGDSVYAADATLSGRGSLAYFGFSYRYYLWRQHTWQIGGGIGLDEIDMGTQLGIRVSTPGKADSLQHHSNLAVPAPMLGLYGDWEFLPRFYFRGQAEWIGGSASGYTLSVTDDRADVEWYAFKNYGIGIGYHYIGADVSKTLRNGDEITLNYTIRGIVAYLKAAF